MFCKPLGFCSEEENINCMKILLGFLKPAVVNIVRHRIWEAQCILKFKLKFKAFAKLLRREVLQCSKLKKEHVSI